MTTKRPPLALKADSFAAHAIPQPDPVQMATASAQRPGSVQSAASPPPAVSLDAAGMEKPTAPALESARPSQPSRAGKVQVVAWIAEQRRAELKIVAAKLRRTVDDLLTSMIDDLVKGHLDS
jgi:hypothetical protein